MYLLYFAYEFQTSNKPSNTGCAFSTFGENCSEPCDCMVDHVVDPEQTCDPVSGFCRCLPNWEGENCGTDVDECLINAHNCDNDKNFVCQNIIGGFECVCREGFSLNSENNCIEGKFLFITFFLIGQRKLIHFYCYLYASKVYMSKVNRSYL